MTTYSAAGLKEVKIAVGDCCAVMKAIANYCQDFGDGSFLSYIRSEDSGLAASCETVANTATAILSKIEKLDSLAGQSLQDFIDKTLENEKQAELDTTEINESMESINDSLNSIDF